MNRLRLATILTLGFSATAGAAELPNLTLICTVPVAETLVVKRGTVSAGGELSDVYVTSFLLETHERRFERPVPYRRVRFTTIDAYRTGPSSDSRIPVEPFAESFVTDRPHGATVDVQELAGRIHTDYVVSQTSVPGDRPGLTGRVDILRLTLTEKRDLADASVTHHLARLNFLVRGSKNEYTELFGEDVQATCVRQR